MAAVPGFLLHVANLEGEAENQDAVHNFRVSRKRMRDACNPFDAPEALFNTSFRLSKHLARALIERLSPALTGKRAFSLSPTVKVLTALKFLACGSYQRGSISLHSLLNVCQSSVSKCLKDFLDAMDNVIVRDVIKFPRTEEQKHAVKLGFYQKFKFPGVIGAVDCTRITIKKPHLNEEQFYCHHNCHCINVQIICDSNLRIINVNPRHGGATNDGYIWRFSIVNNHLRITYQNGETNTWLVGDSGYPVLPWVLTPIVGSGKTPTPEGRYTDRLCLTRNTIERVNGVMKMKWRCLTKERALHYSPRKVRQIVRCCAALHNIALHMPDYLEDAQTFDVDAVVALPEPLADENYNDEFNTGLNVRQTLIEQRFSLPDN